MDEQLEEIVKTLSHTLVIVEKHSEDKRTYSGLIETMYDYIKMGFEHIELRSCPVHFKFFDNVDEPIKKLQLRHFLTNLMCWEPLVQLKMFDKIGDKYVIDCTQLSSDLLKGYIDNNIILPFRKEVGNRKLNKVIHDMIFNLARIPTDFNMILGLSINVETFIDVAERNERFNEIIRTKIPEDMQPHEIEATLNGLMNEQIEILKTEDNFLRPILLSGTGIKDKQLAEFAINGGLKPDLSGNTIPIPINSNFIVGGLGNITNYYIDSLGGRKSVIMNKTVMGKSGHFSRMLMLNTSGIELRRDTKECDTKHPIELEITTGKHLKSLQGRYYRTHSSRVYSVLNGDEEHLIGQKLLFRSPCTCASKKICKMCYGELYHTNNDIRSIGGFAAARITEPLSQMILSSKHLLTTQSQLVEFNPEFYKIFSISSNEIILNVESDEVDVNDYSIVIIKENMKFIDEFDENEFSSHVSLFHVKNKKTGEMIEIAELNGNDLYLAPEFKELVDKDKSSRDYYEVDLSKVGDDDRIFVVEISNNELTKPLHKIMNLLNKSGHEECETIDEMVQLLLDLMIESKINADSVHGELLIRPLIRSTEDVLQTPKFKSYKADYQLLTVEGALQRHPSVLVSMSFQDLGRQLTNPLTFRKREASFIDPFFRERP